MITELRSALRRGVADIRAQLETRGFARVQASDLNLTPSLRQGLEDLKTAARLLPPDRTCAGGYRYRQYGRTIGLPWLDLFEPCPAEWDDATQTWMMEFVQPASMNSEEQGRRRRFAALDRETYANPLVRELIAFDLANVPFPSRELMGPIQVGLHFVRLEAKPGRPALASPNRPHRDGEPFTCAHLIERNGVEGGENYVIDPGWANHPLEDVPEEAIRARFTLDEPLATYIVKDDLVAHHVEGVRVLPGTSLGSRTILLIDFTPLRPQLVMNAAA